MEILPAASQDDRKKKPLTLASLRASALPTVSFPEGLGKPGSSPRGPAQASPLCADGHEAVVQVPQMRSRRRRERVSLFSR